jgi:hypothetical protein
MNPNLADLARETKNDDLEQKVGFIPRILGNAALKLYLFCFADRVSDRSYSQEENLIEYKK